MHGYIGQSFHADMPSPGQKALKPKSLERQSGKRKVTAHIDYYILQQRM